MVSCTFVIVLSTSSNAFKPYFLTYMTAYDVVSTIHQSLDYGGGGADGRRRTTAAWVQGRAPAACTGLRRCRRLPAGRRAA